MKLEIAFSISVKNDSGILTGNALGLQSGIGSMANVIHNIISLNPLALKVFQTPIVF